MNTINTQGKPLGLSSNLNNYSNFNDSMPSIEHLSTAQIETVNRWNEQSRSKQDTSPLRIVLPKLKKPSFAITAWIVTLVLFIMPFAVFGYYLAWSLLLEAFPKAIH
jgi:hypothetical protein